MRKLKKVIISLCTGILLGVCSVSPITSFASVTELSTPSMQSRADVIGWRYKNENNKVYRRQYNYSKQKWLGEWEFVANIVD